MRWVIPNELITEGGEVRFVGTMIEESMQVGDRCRCGGLCLV
jgi:hypothetical protein